MPMIYWAFCTLLFFVLKLYPPPLLRISILLTKLNPLDFQSNLLWPPWKFPFFYIDPPGNPCFIPQFLGCPPVIPINFTLPLGIFHFPLISSICFTEKEEIIRANWHCLSNFNILKNEIKLYQLWTYFIICWCTRHRQVSWCFSKFSLQVQSLHLLQAFQRTLSFQKTKKSCWIVLFNRSQCLELLGCLKALKLFKVTLKLHQILSKIVLQALWRKKPLHQITENTNVSPKMICLQKIQYKVPLMFKFSVSDKTCLFYAN